MYIIFQEFNEKLEVCGNKIESFMRNLVVENASQNLYLKVVRLLFVIKYLVGLEVFDQSDLLYNYQKNKDDIIFFSFYIL